MFKALTIENFRGIPKLEINDFGMINLLVGQNSCGKTTILEALFLLIGASNAELSVRINHFRGIEKVDENFWRFIFHDLNIHSPIKLTGTLAEPSASRELVIKPFMEYSDSIARDTSVKEETFAYGSYSNSLQKVLGLDLKCRFRKNKSIKEIKTAVFLTDSGPKLDIPKNYKEILKGHFINNKTLSIDMDKRFNEVQLRKKTDIIVRALQQIEPRLTSLSLGTDGLIYCDIGLDRLIPLPSMGAGMVKIMSFILTIMNARNGIVLIDEIENGLYPSTQELLWKAMIHTAEEFNSQIFATTHSIECVKTLVNVCSKDNLKKDRIRLFRIEKTDSKIVAVNYDYATLEAALESDWEIR